MKIRQFSGVSFAKYLSELAVAWQGRGGLGKAMQGSLGHDVCSPLIESKWATQNLHLMHVASRPTSLRNGEANRFIIIG